MQTGGQGEERVFAFLGRGRDDEDGLGRFHLGGGGIGRGLGLGGWGWQGLGGAGGEGQAEQGGGERERPGAEQRAWNRHKAHSRVQDGLSLARVTMSILNDRVSGSTDEGEALTSRLRFKRRTCGN